MVLMDLKYNNLLTYLNLSFNEIKNIDILSDSLVYNKSLIRIDLIENKIKNINK